MSSPVSNSDPGSSESGHGLSRQEGLALVLAVLAHVGLIAALTLSPLGKTVQPPPQRMTVSLADTVADKSVSPEPDAQAAPDIAPVVGEPEPAPPQPLAKPEPQPKPVPPPPPPKPEPKPVPKPEPKPVPKPEPKPVPKPEPKPAPKPVPQHKAEAKPEPVQPKTPPAKTNPAKTSPAKPATPSAKPADDRTRHKADAPTGGTKIGDDFLKGIPGSSTPGNSKNSPGDQAGAVSTATLVSTISRQIKPHWNAPQGADAEKLVTVLAWTLNPDGTLAGKPVVVSQSGITPANRAQAERHAEQAIRAVQLAAPFALPPGAYAQWRKVTAFRFDRKLSN